MPETARAHGQARVQSPGTRRRWTLRAIPSPSAEAAQKSPSAPPFATQPSSARMRRDVRGHGAAQPAGGCARIARTTRSPPSRERSRGERVGRTLQRRAERRDTAAPSTAIGDGRRIDLGCPGDLPTHGLLARVVEQPVGRRLPSPRHGRARETPRACPSSCVAIRVGSAPHSRSSSVADASARMRRTRRRAAPGSPVRGAEGARPARRRDRAVPGRRATLGAASPTSEGT